MLRDEATQEDLDSVVKELEGDGATKIGRASCRERV